MLRWTILGFIVLALAGCGKKDASKSGGVNSSFGKSTPTYEWKRPSADFPPPAEPEKKDPF
jgi:hypothetical protein